MPAGGSWAASASSTRTSSPTLDLRAERVIVAELAIAGLAAGEPAVPRVDTPSRHLSVERDLAVIVATTGRRPMSRRPSGATAGRCSGA